MFTKADKTLRDLTPNLEEFWKLQTLGITDPLTDEGDDQALQKFSDTVKYENNRYYVT